MEETRGRTGWRAAWGAGGAFLLAWALVSGGCTGHGVPPEARAQGWDGFWTNFRTAAAARDRGALEPMMTARFDYTFGDGQATPANAFAHWDREEIRGWEALREAAKGSAVDYAPPPQWELKGRVKIAPPEAGQAGYRGWRAVFEQQAGGEWKFVAFLQGD